MRGKKPKLIPPIPIISCPICDPETWTIVGEGRGTYICHGLRCRKISRNILERVKKGES